MLTKEMKGILACRKVDWRKFEVYEQEKDKEHKNSTWSGIKTAELQEPEEDSGKEKQEQKEQEQEPQSKKRKSRNNEKKNQDQDQQLQRQQQRQYHYHNHDAFHLSIMNSHLATTTQLAPNWVS